MLKLKILCPESSFRLRVVYLSFLYCMVRWKQELAENERNSAEIFAT